MADQLRRLRDAAALPNVWVQVLPFAAGAHQFLRGPAAILQYGEPGDQDVVYLEGFAGSCEVRPAVVAKFRAAFDELSEKALDQRRSIDLMEGMIKH